MALRRYSLPGQQLEPEKPLPKRPVGRPRKRLKPESIEPQEPEKIATPPAPVILEEVPAGPDQTALQEILQDLDLIAKRRAERRIDYFEPYDKQAEFFAMGATRRERLLMAGNQLGKTEAGAVETAFHMTGDYPEWWIGKRFPKATRGWIIGETSLLVRDVQQNKLCGKPGVDDLFGTGLIPKAAFHDKPSLARGVTDAYDTIQVKHKSGGISTATFKSYEQGRQKFQGEPIDWAWPDEEPDMDIYSEILTRVTATRGIVYVTFTPLKGMSDVVGRFLSDPSPDRGVVTMVIEDAKHIPAEERQKIIDGYPAHERAARARGVPMLGSGRIFPYSDEALAESPVELHRVPPEWFKGWGIDFGIGHPFGAVLCAWDKDANVFHVLRTHRVADARPPEHARAMKISGINAPVAWPQDGTAREKSGEQVASLYKAEGLKMMHAHATHPDGSIGTEAAIREMDMWMAEGRFKVAEHLADWFEEFRLYHRKDGLIVKLRDDLMSATRVAFMMRRFFRQVALGGQMMRRRQQTIASGVDFDLF